MSENNKRKDRKKEHLLQLGLVFATVITLYVIGSIFNFRADLTSDKRYTLSEHTVDMVENLEDIVYFKIYLDGDLPPGFERLKQATRRILEEFKVYGKDKIHFEFIDPMASESETTRREIFKQLVEKGINPTNLHVKESDGSASQKIIFPGLIVSYRQEEWPVDLLKNYTGLSSEAILNQSVQALEYEITFAIDQLINKNIPSIGIVRGHGELNNLEIGDLLMELGKSYKLQVTTMEGDLASLRDTLGKHRYDLLLIARPTQPFTSQDKFLLDQHIMHGGKILWMVDPVNVNLDSLAYSRSTMAFENKLNLDDMFFKYGIRFNKRLVQDMQCAVIPVNTALAGQQPNFTPSPWVYFPLASPSQNHSISKNLDMVKLQFSGTIDTVGSNSKVSKTVLMSSSKYSRYVNSPTLIDLGLIEQRIDQRMYNKGNQNVAVLVEGQFNSVFENRVPKELENNQAIDFKPVSPKTQMVFIADGDIARNPIKGSGDNAEPLPLGFDRFTKQTFGNKDFIINTINYLCDKKGLLDSRKKEVKLRLLDRPKINGQKTFWQLINILLPLLFVILITVIWSILRKKYTTK
jgi:ABC-2 type transport system permease protein